MVELAVSHIGRQRAPQERCQGLADALSYRLAALVDVNPAGFGSEALLVSCLLARVPGAESGGRGTNVAVR
jgi:hypothetical protein